MAGAISRAIAGCRFRISGAPLFGDEAAHRYHAEVAAAATGMPIEFTGWTSDVRSVLATLDLLLVPSAGHDATPRVIPEAFSAGVPVIAFPSGGIPELIEDDSTGFLAPSVEAMAAKAIELLASRPERLATVSQAARASWRANFTLARFQRQMVETIERCAAGLHAAHTVRPA